ncbi:MAG TPA: Abi-alpha family protein [Pelobium sp.]|nr:Abi-alpha family protein [Pelobium sp.]
MDQEKPKVKLSLEGFDPLGLKSAGEILKKSVDFGIDGAKEFLKLTCKPFLEEVGLGFKDKATNWRLTNIVTTLDKAKGKFQYDSENEKIGINPKIAYQIIENASIVDNEALQEMWAGLYASSCYDRLDDENIIFIDLLKRLTSSQVKFLNYVCEKSTKTINLSNVHSAKEDGHLNFPIVEICQQNLSNIMNTDNKLKIETEINSLERFGLIISYPPSHPVEGIYGKIKRQDFTRIGPTLLATRLYIKCQGSLKTPFNYFLPQITQYYFNLIKDYVPVKPDEVIEFIHENVRYAKEFEKDINFESEYLKIKNEEWHSLTKEELNNRLRSYSIFRFIQGLPKTYTVEINNDKIGTFNYLDGIKPTS